MKKKKKKKKQKFGSISSLLTSIRQDARFCFQEIFINKMYLMWCNPEKISVDAFVSGLNSQGAFPRAIYVVLRHAIKNLKLFRFAGNLSENRFAERIQTQPKVSESRDVDSEPPRGGFRHPPRV